MPILASQRPAMHTGMSRLCEIYWLLKHHSQWLFLLLCRQSKPSGPIGISFTHVGVIRLCQTGGAPPE